MKTLYFEGAGWFGADSSKATNMDNCRVRTAFHLDDGRAVYLELSYFVNDRKPINKRAGISSCHYIIDNDTDCENHYRIKVTKEYEYNREGITQLVNDLGASFDTVMTLPNLAGYRVFKDKGGYNYGDEFKYDPELTKLREEIHNEIYSFEKQELEKDRKERTHKYVHSPSGNEYPNFSLWVDETNPKILHLLRHFNGYNKHWSIKTYKRMTAAECIERMTETTLGKYGC